MVGRFLGTVIVTLHGRIDQINAAALADVLDDLIDGQGNLAIVVDLRDVRWIDGVGVRVLASAAAGIASRGGELRLGGPTDGMAEALSLAGLRQLVSIPYERALRSWPRSASDADSARQAGIQAHPAGTGRQYLRKGEIA